MEKANSNALGVTTVERRVGRINAHLALIEESGRGGPVSLGLVPLISARQTPAMRREAANLG